MQERLRELVLFDLYYFLEPLCFSFTIVVQKYLEAERVILVLAKSESVVADKESVVASTVAIEELLAFAVACLVTGVHSEERVRHLWLEPILVVFHALLNLLVNVNASKHSSLGPDFI